MKIRKDNSNLSIDEQIKLIKYKIRFLIVFSIIWSVFIIAICIILIVILSMWKLAIGFLLTLPCSIVLGGVMPILEYKKKIKNNLVDFKESNEIEQRL